jgi:hypothetical protein
MNSSSDLFNSFDALEINFFALNCPDPNLSLISLDFVLFPHNPSMSGFSIKTPPMSQTLL